MKSFVVWCLAAGVTCGMFVGASIAQEAKGKKNAAPGQNAQVFNLPKEVELTEAQQEKLLALKKEYGPKVAELQKKIDDVLTADQLAARKSAAAKAKADNVTGKARQEALAAAVKLSPEQQKKSDALQAEMRELQGKIRGQIAGFLTDEQKAKVPNLAPKTKKAKKTT